MTVDNFDLKKAAHAKQAAYVEMSETQQKMTTLSNKITVQNAEIDKRQRELDELNVQTNREWEAYNSAQLVLKASIGSIITSIKECNTLEENLRLMSQDESEDPAKASIYEKGAEFFSKLASEKMLERDQLITKKRAMIRPDNSARSLQLVDNLKTLRKERAERLNDYHALKNELSLKKANFDRLKGKYDAIKNGTDETEDYTFRPVVLDNSKNKRLLIDAGIPEEFHDSCTIKQRSDGKIDIYYGGTLEMEHGHIIVENDSIIFSRKPTPKSTAL